MSTRTRRTRSHNILYYENHLMRLEELTLIFSPKSINLSERRRREGRERELTQRYVYTHLKLKNTQIIHLPPLTI